jgi:hypothetical protein
VRIAGAGLAAVLFVAALPRGAAAQARDPRIQAMIDRATASMRGVMAGSGHEQTIGAYALVASGASAKDPAVTAAVAKVVARTGTTGYQPGPHHFYEAGADAMLLEAVDQLAHKDQLAQIAKYIIDGQETTGCWNYASEKGRGGDTSVNGFALLGLWAAARAGVAVPRTVWEKAAAWHLAAQYPSGVFPYKPHMPDHNFQGENHAMAAAGAANLLVCRLHLFPDAPPPLSKRRERPAPSNSGPRFGVLQEVDLDKVPEAGREAPERTGPAAELPRLDAAVERAVGWLAARYTMSKPTTYFPTYYLYVVERLCTIADTSAIGGHDWYLDGAAALAQTQNTEGFWTGPHAGQVATSAFAVLFLARVTGKIVGRTPEPVAGGILIGARGLPDDLKNVKIVDGKAEQPKLKGPIADLLTKLENLEDVPVESAQEAIVEQVLVGDREALVGQKDRLRKLATAKDAEIRRTAVWALARCDDLRLAPIMIRALDDSDVDVLVEARNALCYLSRQPRGDGQKDTPLADVAEDASDEQKSQAVAKWRSAVRTHWRTWYFRVRPYDERDDLDEIETLRAANPKK